MLKPYCEATKGKQPEAKKKPPNVRCEKCDDEFVLKKSKLFGRSMPRCGKCGGHLELLEPGEGQELHP
jgi:Zn finger protein HypA/HybF involved in hydrogenase expression